MIEPRCLENHHDTDGTLIVFQGAVSKTCCGCKSMEECFAVFAEYRNHLHILRCKDRRCDDSMPELYDINTPLCFNENTCGTTYCQSQLEFGCPRGFEKE